MTEVRHMFSSPAGALASLNVATSANTGASTRVELPRAPTVQPLAALALTPWPVSHQPADYDTIVSFQNQTATAPGQHGVPFEKPRTAVPFQCANAASTAPVANVTQPPTKTARGTSSTTSGRRKCVSRTLSPATAAAPGATSGNMSRFQQPSTRM